ncbi:hypothetical protein D3C75_548620 [compost metagenome]
MAYDKIHMSFVAQRFRTAVISDQHHPARVQPVLRMRGDRLRYIMPGGAAAHFGIHPQPDAFNHILSRYTFMVPCYAGGSINRKSPVTGRPGEMPIHVSACAECGLDFAQHLLIPVHHSREVHDFTQSDDILTPGIGFGNFRRSERGAGCFELRPCRRYTGSHLHIRRKRRAAHFIQHQLNTLQPEYICDFMRIKESACRSHRQHRTGKFGNGQLSAFNMAMSVK